MHDLAQFSMADMAACSSALRQMGKGAQSMEEVSGRIVEYLYGELSGGKDREKPFALVRLFKTHSYGELAEDLRSFAQRLLGREPASNTKCLTLLATAGIKPEWRSRALSVGHQAIPLASVEGVARIPMIANLVQQFGLEVSQILHPEPGVVADLSKQSFNVFHVEEAVGNPNIPAQDEFIVAEGIRSCLGFGGTLPHGDLFAVIMFSRMPISSNTASLFRSLSLSVRIALLPFELRVFAAHPNAPALPGREE
ncbi:MAG: hypothetical protein HYZ37_03900 [Candidatus Solibacter usitatus]|nr:hypothetical protein [Candidatus Solibacter usitatus]